MGLWGKLYAQQKTTYLDERCKWLILSVGATGFEPVTLPPAGAGCSEPLSCVHPGVHRDSMRLRLFQLLISRSR